MRLDRGQYVVSADVDVTATVPAQVFSCKLQILGHPDPIDVTPESFAGRLHLSGIIKQDWVTELSLSCRSSAPAKISKTQILLLHIGKLNTGVLQYR
jgi:hypothetical protein